MNHNKNNKINKTKNYPSYYATFYNKIPTKEN